MRSVNDSRTARTEEPRAFVLHGVVVCAQASGMVQRTPILFLITDGAVDKERDICRYMQESGSGVRAFTLSIGPYANRYFLKMLAQVRYRERLVCVRCSVCVHVRFVHAASPCVMYACVYTLVLRRSRDLCTCISCTLQADGARVLRGLTLPR
jgi:hypothetical protein